jgi:hypothetical protein
MSVYHRRPILDDRDLETAKELFNKLRSREEMYAPTFGSNLASLRYPMIFLMDSTEPFLYSHHYQYGLVAAFEPRQELTS